VINYILSELTIINIRHCSQFIHLAKMLQCHNAKSSLFYQNRGLGNIFNGMGLIEIEMSERIVSKGIIFPFYHDYFSRKSLRHHLFQIFNFNLTSYFQVEDKSNCFRIRGGLSKENDAHLGRVRLQILATYL